MTIHKELKWTNQRMNSRVNLSEIASKSLAVGVVRWQDNQKREEKYKRQDR